MTKLGSQFVSEDTHARGTKGDKGDTGATGATGPTGPSGPDINTTKGDVAGFDTASARIPIGADTFVLTADSAQALGLKWAAGVAGDPLTTKGDLFGFNTDAARIPIGTNTFVLTADSGEALGLKWAAVPSGDPLTTKGDLFTFDTDAQRLAVGANTFVLTADSAEATGIKWAAPAAGGGNAFDELAADTNYSMLGELARTGSQRTDSTILADLVYCDFLFFDGVTTINQIAVNSATASGGGTLTVGLHPVTSRLFIGDQSFVGTITVSTSANVKHTGVVDWTPTKGWYMLAAWTPASITNLTFAAASTASGEARFFPAFSWSMFGDTEVEIKTHIITKTNYDTTPDLSAIDFNDIGIYDSTSADELSGSNRVLIVELRST